MEYEGNVKTKLIAARSERHQRLEIVNQGLKRVLVADKIEACKCEFSDSESETSTSLTSDQIRELLLELDAVVEIPLQFLASDVSQRRVDKSCAKEFVCPANFH